MGRKGPQVRSVEERFWQYVKKTPTCWLWTASVRKGGYGQIWNGTKINAAHRQSWEMKNGPIPEGLHCLHKCDTPQCVRPSHLFIGTNTDNMHDMRDKGRKQGINGGLFGAGHGMAKLTDADVIEIRSLDGKRSRRSIAKEYGVTRTAVYAICTRKTWKHL